MKLRDRRAGLLVLMIGMVPMLIGASRPLNPLVTRASVVTGPVPPECEQGLSDTPVPRVQVAEIPLPETNPADVAPPPRRALRTELEEAQAALVRNDRPAFDEHLGAAREIAASYPPGGEKRAADDVLAVYDAAARAWDAQFESPFFDTGSDAYASANAFPGYEDAVRRQVLVDDEERRFYPAAETRTFLSQVASTRLARLGISSPAPRTQTRVARVTEEDAARPLPSVKPRHARSRAKSKTRVAAASRKPVSTQRSEPMPAASAPSKPSPPDHPAHAVAAAPAPATAPPAVAPTPTPAAGEVPIPDTDTSMTTAPATAQPSKTRSVVLPAILILIGLGVLIVLFRASK